MNALVASIVRLEGSFHLLFTPLEKIPRIIAQVDRERQTFSQIALFPRPLLLKQGRKALGVSRVLRNAVESAAQGCRRLLQASPPAQ